MNKLTTRKKRAFYTALIFGVLAINLFLAEGIIRLYHLSQHRQRMIWIPDPVLGYRLTPNHRFQYVFEEREGTYRVTHHTNSLGLLTQEIPLQKPARTKRVIILGDSFTEAMQVENEKSFSSLLEKWLNENNSDPLIDRYEVINAGVSGFSPISSYLYLKNELMALDPDIIILQLFANDAHNDYEATAMSVMDEFGLPLKINRYFYKDEKSVIDPAQAREKYHESTWPNRWHGWLIKTSRFYEYIYTKAVKTHKNAPFNKKMKNLPEFHHDNYFFVVQPTNPLFRNEVFRAKALALTQKYILAIRDLTQRHGGNFYLFYIPLHEQLLRDDETKQKLYFSHPANTFFNEYLENMSREKNIPFLDLLPAFENFPLDEIYFRQDIHLTPKGHQIVAEQLWKKFFNQRSVDP